MQVNNRDRIYTGKGFVKKKDVGILEEEPAEGDPPLLASRLARLGPVACAAAMPDLLEAVRRARQGTDLMDGLLVLALGLGSVGLKRRRQRRRS